MGTSPSCYIQVPPPPPPPGTKDYYWIGVQEDIGMLSKS